MGARAGEDFSGDESRRAAPPSVRPEPGPLDDPAHELLSLQAPAPGPRLRALPRALARAGRHADHRRLPPALAGDARRRAPRLSIRRGRRTHARRVFPRRGTRARASRAPGLRAEPPGPPPPPPRSA